MYARTNACESFGIVCLHSDLHFVAWGTRTVPPVQKTTHLLSSLPDPPILTRIKYLSVSLSVMETIFET